MARCMTCGNEYDNTFEVKVRGDTFTFDCFECAIQRLAPACEACGCRVVGHGVQSASRIFCSSHCARSRGIEGLSTRV